MDTHETTSIVGISTLTTALAKVEGLFQDNSIPGYLDGFQKWLRNRTEEWEKTALRIGVVGITSAGKSTFVNALAGEDILPRGAQPTSGVLVVCRKTPERKLTVLFRDKSKYEFAGTECNHLWVCRYGDEGENPNNEQNVMEIHLALPALEIPETYELIDSPGLDAFGLEGHEELTLRTLVPLVDLVLFLTTTKSTSDRENLRALSNICKESKPIVVVQTHKDAVEPRYAKGGKILETKEEVLEKHAQRVKQLLGQTPNLENTFVIQVSSIQALHARQENPDTPAEKLPAWEASGIGEVVSVLRKLQKKLSQNIATRRLHLLFKELQQLSDKVKADYYTARGKLEEADLYKQAELKRVQELQDLLPAEDAPEFPDAKSLVQEVTKVKEFFLEAVAKGEERRLETLSMEVRDKIKTLESAFFRQVDGVESKLRQVAEQLAIDLEAIRPEETTNPQLPQLKRYEKLVKMDVIEESGFVGTAKRMLGKLLKKEEWGFKEKEVTETCIDRESLKQDLSDYYATYSLRLNNYLKRWGLYWINSVAAIFTAVEQRREDVSKSQATGDPEPYRKMLANIREVRDWLEGVINAGAQKRYTMGFQVMKKEKVQALAITTQTKAIFDLLLPLLQVSRTLNFNRKTHRFWYTVQRLVQKPTSRPVVLISTPFSHEIFDYLGRLGDLPVVEETEMVGHAVIYSLDDHPWEKYGLPIKKFSNFAEGSREHWFLDRNTILLFHDSLLELPDGPGTFSALLMHTDAVLRVVDFHQIGHERKRLDKLPIKENLFSVKAKLGYIAMGVDRLLKSDQFVDSFKSYLSLEKPPGFGLLPLLVGDGEEILNSLLWLGSSLHEDTVTDEIKAMDILHRTQGKLIEGREKFIRNLFHEIKEYRRVESMSLLK